MKNIFKILLLLLLLLPIIGWIFLFSARYPMNGFLLSAEQEKIIEDISNASENNSNGFGFEVINPENDWDTVCIVLPYSYNPFYSSYSKIRELYGQNYNRHRVFLPDPSSQTYGMIFSFLKNENISKLVHIPRYKFSLSIENGVVVAPTTFDINGIKIIFDNITFDLPNNRKCFSKGSAYILISEDRVFKVGVK